MSGPVRLEYRNVSMHFAAGGGKKQLTAVSAVSFLVRDGEVVSLIGPSGCGKSTLLNIGSGLVGPSAGEAFVDGERVEGPNAHVAFMLQKDLLLPWRTVAENVMFGVEIQGVPRGERRARVRALLDAFNLAEFADRYPYQLSGGMRQRVALARTLAVDPSVLLLDEPASGLDPRARIEIRALLKELRAMGKTILVSSHILPELADICNKIGIIEQGCLLVNGEVSEVMKQVRTDIVLNIAVAQRLTDAAGLLENQPEVESVQDKNGVLIVKLNEGVNQYGFLANRLIEQGYELTMFKEDEINLETAFMHLTKGITS